MCRGGLSLSCGAEPLGLLGRPPPLESELCFAITFVSVAHGTPGQVVGAGWAARCGGGELRDPGRPGVTKVGCRGERQAGGGTTFLCGT